MTDTGGHLTQHGELGRLDQLVLGVAQVIGKAK